MITSMPMCGIGKFSFLKPNQKERLFLFALYANHPLLCKGELFPTLDSCKTT